MRYIYAVIDTETTTLPELANIKNGGLDFPLIYDIGLVITDRNGIIYYKNNWIVNEVFYNEYLFKSAHYVEKRPIYENMIYNKNINRTNWFDITAELDTIFALYNVTHVCAYNARFDFKKAFPFTNRFMYAYKKNKVNDFIETCITPASYEKDKTHTHDFKMRSKWYPILDIWTIACQTIFKMKEYRKLADNYGWYTKTGRYSTTAELAYRFISGDDNFDESHTALHDAEIETAIMHEVFSKHSAISYGLNVNAHNSIPMPEM
jgi:hypothetical protein